MLTYDSTPVWAGAPTAPAIRIITGLTQPGMSYHVHLTVDNLSTAPVIPKASQNADIICKAKFFRYLSLPGFDFPPGRSYRWLCRLVLRERDRSGGV